MPEYALRPDTVEAYQVKGYLEEDTALLRWVVENGGTADLIYPVADWESSDECTGYKGHEPQFLIEYRDAKSGKDVTERLGLTDWVIKERGYGHGYFKIMSDTMFRALYTPTDHLEMLRMKLTEGDTNSQ